MDRVELATTRGEPWRAAWCLDRVQRELLERPGWEPPLFLDVARAWLRLAGAASAADRDWCDEAHRRALDVLALAVEHGFRDIRWLETAPELEPLRQTTAFRDLVAAARTGPAG
jgi:hypothetical protein